MKNRERALLVSEKAHAGQSYDIYPYMYHILQVVKIAEELGYDDTVIVSAALHDILEDAALSYGDILKSFGVEVAEVVYAVTDERGRNRQERKMKTYPKIKANWRAVVVKVCDRIANLEHSREYNKDLFKMYLKESSDFKENLYFYNEETEKAWKRLFELISQTRIKQKNDK